MGFRPIADIRSLDKVETDRCSIRFRGTDVKLYRINKVQKPGGTVLKHKDVLAETDKEALQRARHSDDCPVCDVLRDGRPIGSIV